ncbi:MAG: hydroxyethylthiazole kinase [Acutalibacteraceae bacterium]|jgi:hydroxyethylthiazole kinase
MFAELLENLKKRAPLIHSITNYVTANDCANLLLACGASPIMADDAGEAAEITSRCDGLNINIGTLDRRVIPAMLAAGKRANELGRPVLLDPVGAGASALRTDTALELLRQIHFSVVRGNVSEIKTLAAGSGSSRGVDAGIADRVTEETLENAVVFAKGFARRTGAVVAMTGEIDVVADGERAFCIRNGHSMMSRVTGTGCQLSALTTAMAAANPQQITEAAAAAVCAMGLCGEIACRRLGAQDGNAACRSYIIDAVYRLTPEQLEEGARYEMR